MAGFGSRPGIAAAVTGTAVWLEAAAARLLFGADEARVYFLGNPLGWECSFRRQSGLPCPTCGLTRSVVLSLHGEPQRAWSLAPGGPVVVYGMLAFAAAILVLAATQALGIRKWQPAAQAWLRQGALWYSGAALLIWIGGWVVSFSAAWHAR